MELVFFSTNFVIFFKNIWESFGILFPSFNSILFLFFWGKHSLIFIYFETLEYGTKLLCLKGKNLPLEMSFPIRNSFEVLK
jgi:hypothetical protein